MSLLDPLRKVANTTVSMSRSSTISVPKVGSVSIDGAIDLSKGLASVTGGVKLKKDGGNVFTSGATTKSVEDESHQAISSYFIGPQAENLGFFQDNLNTIIEQLRQARLNYYPSDGEFISDSIQESAVFQTRTQDVARAVEATSKILGKHSIPFWNPRYQAHMGMDLSMPAMLGYIATMMYNPNNVAFEASPLTTLIEMEVGNQLCEMFGYRATEDPSKRLSWGHVTCDGTIANLESIWAARNLKFYPLSIRMALDGPLNFVAPTFKGRTSQNEEKLFVDMTAWELLNLKPETILDIPDRLNGEYGISSKFLEDVMNEFGIQSRGKESLEREFGMENQIQYMVANTRHYSWPKGAAIAGIGSDNMIGINVDHGARIDMQQLEQQLEKNLKNQQAVYAVVAIIGSTEEGAVDRLGEILAMRRRFQARGLSFIVHADAAWGGYFASMLPRDYAPGVGGNLPVGFDANLAEGFVPDSSLRLETQEDIWWLRHADSITVDPHKAGYVPYPAGGLCYKDGRLKNLITWSSPYLSQGSSLNIGVFGVEGSKPGASAVSTFLSNKCIGLEPEGYGALLGEVTFTCSRVSAQWAAMTDETMPYTVVPFNMLPSELSPNSTLESVAAEKKWIRDNILSASNLTIAANQKTSPGGDTAMSLLRKLGSDLNINAFAINFHNKDGKLNTDTLEANKLMQRVVQHFSVDSPADKPNEIPLYLTSTEFSPKLYGECAKNFKRRLGLNTEDGHELFVLRNVVMSPFPTERDFIAELANIFKKVVEAEVQTSQDRNESRQANHEFLLHGNDRVFLIHKPNFHDSNLRRQMVLEVDLPNDVREWYKTLQAQYPHDVLTFNTYADLNKTGELSGYMNSQLTGPILPSFTLTVKSKLVDRSLTGPMYSTSYPASRMPFYLYGSFGSSKPEYHIDHALLKGPNIQLSASNITLSGVSKLPNTPLLLTLDTIRESALQPFADKNAVLDAQPSFFFRPGRKLDVSIWRDPVPRTESNGNRMLEAWEKLGERDLVGRGTITLTGSLYADSEGINRDKDKTVDCEAEWKKEFERYLVDVSRS